LAAQQAERLRLSAAAGNLATDVITNGLLLVAQVASQSATVGGENNTAVNAQATQSVANAAGLLTNLAFNINVAPLSVAEQQQVQQATVALLTTTAQVARNTRNIEDVISLVQNQNNITLANQVLGIAATPNQIAATTAASVEISTKVAAQALQDLGLGTNLSAQFIQAELAKPQNANAVSAVINASLRIPPSTVRSTTEQIANATAGAGANPPSTLIDNLRRANAVSTDISATSVGGLSAADAILRLFGGGTTGMEALTDTMLDVNGRVANVSQLGANTVSVRVDPITSLVTISLPGETYSGTAAGVRAVPSTLPSGVRFNADGSGIIVNSGLAIEFAPAPSDLVKFVNAVERAGFPFLMRPNGAITLQVGNGELFSGAFAYDNLTGIDLAACGALSFIEPRGALNNAGYAFSVRCANGASQRMVPFIESTTFVNSVRAFGLTPSTDRNTGFVTIPTVGVFKPNFFVLPLTAADQAFHAANKDALGNAVQYLDANGDGKLDVRLITATGSQLLFGVN
jgi:hypothetical protein